MNAPQIIEECARAGIRLEASGHDLLVSPKGALTDELRARLRASKFEILAALYDDMRPMRGCWNCGAREFVTIVGRPGHLWFCDGCQGPYAPERIAERWTTPLESMGGPWTSAVRKDGRP